MQERGAQQFRKRRVRSGALSEEFAKVVVLLSCGPASRVGVMSIMRRVEGVTALDVGSLFDPWTRGIRLPYHDDPDLRQCPACAGPVRTKRWTSVHERLVDRGSA